MFDFLKRYALLVCAGLYTLGLIFLHALGRFPSPGSHDLSHLTGTPVLTLQGRVLNFPATRWGQTRFLMEGRTVPDGTHTGRVVVTLHFPLEDLAPDESVQVRGWLTQPRDPSVRHPFDERAYWAGFRAYSILHVWSPEALERRHTRRPTWTQRAWQFRQHFQQFWFDHLPPEEAALLCCITLGSRGILPMTIKQQCIRAGVYHILVVSGQKMALIVLLAIGCLRLLRVPRRWAFWICCPWIVFYACAVGADPPVVRAASMAIVALAVMALGRDVPGYVPFALAWFWILVKEPEALFGASFQLSFGATASLLAVLPLLRFSGSIRQRFLRWLVDAGIVSLAVIVGVWPLLVYYFHQLSIVGFLANWTLFPFSGLLMVVGLLLGVWGVWLPGGVPDSVIQGVHWALKGTLVAIERMSGWTWAAIPLSAPPWPVIVVYYSVLICILFNLDRDEKKSIAL